MRETVLIAGAMAQRPRRAGHAWLFVNWMLAFQSAGHEVLFVDQIDSTVGDVDIGVAWVREVMAFAGLDDAWSVLLDGGTAAGRGRADVAARSSGAFLLNVMGYLDDDVILGAVERRVFLDIDPGFGQAWEHSGLATIFSGHHAYATVGLNVGTPGCAVPDLGVAWIPTLPPVDLHRWEATPPGSGSFTTVGSWRGPFAPVEVDGIRYGLRAHTARGYADLPTRSGAPLEVALDIDSTDDADRWLLQAGGWALRDPRVVAADMASYRAYIGRSSGEFGIAKEVYVGLRSGWFSDRSACYLASGRPVVVTETGFSSHLPVGEGLFAYSDPDEAAYALAEVMADPARHGKAARQLAEERFDGRQIARSLLERVA